MRTALAIATLALVAAPPAEPVPLFTAMPFDGWKREGSPAAFTISGTDATATLDGLGENLAANSFLTSPRPLGDFTLEVEVRIEPGTNSGIQVRSRVEDGRVRGPQVEIDPTPRAWSGGIYDEGDRGWMHPLEGREEARKAFIVGAWNRYRIECDGPRIRTWVNGVACSDWLDAKSVEGLLAFQVHSGPRAHVEWRNPSLLERGRHAWTPVDAATDGTFAIPADASGVRVAPGPWTSLSLVDADGRVIRLRADGTESPRDAATADRGLDILFAGGRLAVRRDGRPTLELDAPPPASLRADPPSPPPAVSALRPQPRPPPRPQ